MLSGIQRRRNGKVQCNIQEGGSSVLLCTDSTSTLAHARFTCNLMEG